MSNLITRRQYCAEDYPIGLASPKLRRKEAPFYTHVHIDKLLNSFLHTVLDQEIPDPESPKDTIYVRELLKRHWHLDKERLHVGMPVYLKEYWSSYDQQLQALACFYTGYKMTLEHLDTEGDCWEFTGNLTKCFRSLPTHLRGFVNRMSWSDSDFVMTLLGKRSGLSNLTRFLKQVDPEAFGDTNFCRGSQRIRAYRRSFYELVVRYAAVESLVSTIEKYFSKYSNHQHKLLNVRLWKGNGETAISQIQKSISDLYNKSFGTPETKRKIPFSAEEGAVYQMIFPVPDFIEVKRANNVNALLYNEDRLATFEHVAGSRLVEVDVEKAMAYRQKKVSEVPVFNEETYVAAMSSNPTTFVAPSSLLVPDLNDLNAKYIFGCARECDGWEEYHDTMFYWNPIKNAWVSHVVADHNFIKDSLKRDFAGIKSVNIYAVKHCPFCGAGLSNGHPYLIRGRLPLTHRFYSYEEDYIKVKSPEIKYHIDLWDRILQFYFRGEFLQREDITFTDNYIYKSENKIVSRPEVTLRRSGEGLYVGEVLFSKQELIHLSFVLYQSSSMYEEAMFGKSNIAGITQIDVGRDK